MVLRGSAIFGPRGSTALGFGGHARCAFPGAENIINILKVGGTLDLKDNLLLGSPIVIDNPKAVVTLNLNGKTIQNVAKTADEYQAAIIVKNGKLIINGEGVVDGGSGCAGNVAVWAGRNGGNGEVHINGGTYINGADAEGNGSEVIYANGNGKVFINGGTFEAGAQMAQMKEKYAALNVADADYKAGKANIIVKGGIYKKFNPADNLSEGEGTNFVADGYVSKLMVNSSTDYEVVAE